MRHRFRPGTHLTVGLWKADGTFLRDVEVRVVHATAVREDGCPVWLLGCAFDQPLADEEVQALR
jgi:hypothetical protein